MTLQTWILILAVFAAVVVTRLGRHRYTRRQRLLTLGVLALLILKYVRGMPTAGGDLAVELICAGIGAAFGFGMLAVTSVEPDDDGREVWVRAGVAYLVLWVVMLGSRVAFAYSASGWDKVGIGRFLRDDRISSLAITPAFVLMTVASLAVVTIGTALRVASLNGSRAVGERLQTAQTFDSAR